MEDFYAEIIGTGQDAIFLPAGGMPGVEGLNIAEHLKNDFRVHMLDLPGIGRSAGIAEKCTSKVMADWLKEYLDKQEIEKAVLIGHSLGGGFAIYFAHHYPERVTQLFLLDQGHKDFPRIPFQEFGPFALAFPILNWMVHLCRRPVLKILHPLFSSPPSEDVEKDIDRFCEAVNLPKSNYIDQTFYTPCEVTIEGLNVMFGFYNTPLVSMVQKLTVPTTLFYASFKGVNKAEEARTIKAIDRLLQRRNSKLTIKRVDGGHYVHWNNDYVKNHIAEQFISSH
ncbi:alpha/beta hydrolase [Halobacillus halophilus]|uniref:AB hydrolase superfamily protein n=1 Tax=Halobacillus halophilus (strain ATCC 35676 / DSM 2266 / JCM 20832 / KCTC 3685 / LMG 17431 / NBRC 102448 / NCIMB 2269) TaxID=866895 RepID=I0JHQ0_HALH3|nr:alpha/beta hydrolase [Halobacillus halophilus]ASF37881.1 alpha/beta hydrolase [Halobacillus halophilus]CCG43668.1 AB hydrolase superfamily protein [Halobacillus halophilus DSM 2266]